MHNPILLRINHYNFLLKKSRILSLVEVWVDQKGLTKEAGRKAGKIANINFYHLLSTQLGESLDQATQVLPQLPVQHSVYQSLH